MELHFCARIPAIKIDGGNNFGEQINKQPLHNVESAIEIYYHNDFLQQ